jgi:hypothetical protein
VNSLQSVILVLSVAYALLGALLLLFLVYSTVRWPAKAAVILVVSVFYVVTFGQMRGLLGWPSTDRLPASFKLLQARIVEPHSFESDPGSIYLWVEELDQYNRPSGLPRAYRVPYSDSLAARVHAAENEIAAGRLQGGRAADFGGGNGTILDMVREYITPRTIIETSGGDSSTGEFMAPPPGARDGIVFTPLLPIRMPPKDAE